MANTDCPECRAESDLEDPNAQAVLTCIHCGYVGIWDTEAEAWRLLRPEEHERLMDNEEFLDSISFGMAFRSWRARDTAALRAVICSKTDGLRLASSIVDGLVREIIDAGYHTHPTEADIQALGLGRVGDTL